MNHCIYPGRCPGMPWSAAAYGSESGPATYMHYCSDYFSLRMVHVLTGSSMSDSSVCMAAPLFISRNLLNDSSITRFSFNSLHRTERERERDEQRGSLRSKMMCLKHISWAVRSIAGQPEDLKQPNTACGTSTPLLGTSSRKLLLDCLSIYVHVHSPTHTGW